MKHFLLILVFNSIVFAQYNYHIIEKNFSKYLIYKDAKYKLDFEPKFCKTEGDGCYATGVFFKKIESLKEPIIILKSLKGMHSVLLNIYNPNVNKTKEVKHYIGNFGLNYDETKDGYCISYDTGNSNRYPDNEIEFYSPKHPNTTNAFYFQKNKSFLNKTMKNKIKIFATIYNEQISGLKSITLRGYTHNLHKNKSLTTQRVLKIKKELIKQNISASQIEILSPKESILKNERVEFSLKPSILGMENF